MKLEVAIAIYVFIGYNGAESSANSNGSKITEQCLGCEKFDALTEQLIGHRWSKDERFCLEQLLKTISNVKNSTLWATWIWDSIQLPVGQLYGSKYHLGNYDQCLRETVGSSLPPFRTQYCLADLVLGVKNHSNLSPEDINPYASTEDYVATRTKLKQSFNVITWGVCVPESCQTGSVKKFLRALLKQSHLGHMRSPVDITVTHCEPAGETTKHIDGLHIVVVAVILTSVFGWYCTKYTSKYQNINSDSFATNVLKCFCLNRNTKEWLQQNKNDVQVLHGIRYFSSCLLIFLHNVFVTLTSSMGNGLDFEEHMLSEYFLIGPLGLSGVQYSHMFLYFVFKSSYGYWLLLNSLLLVVDTFFLISGLLHVKNAKPINTLGDLVRLLVKRYFRLIWWYILTTLLIIFIMPRSGCGPLCSKFMAPEYDHCVRGWWLGFLTIGNYIHDINICNPVAWYIFSDFHLTVMATMLLWLRQKNPRAALVCFSIIAALSISLPASTVYKAPEIITIKVDFELYKTLKDGMSVPTLELYQRTHNRAIPYVVGMVMGYMMSNYRALKIRTTFTKKQFVSLLCIMLVWIILFWLSNENFKAAILLVTVRLVWAGLNCALIASSEYGYMPYLKTLFSWPIFVPLSKLTYGAYMIHIITISYTRFSTRSSQYVSRYVLTEQYLGNLLLSNILSLIFLLFVESPLNNFVKLLCSSGTETEMKTIIAGGDRTECGGASPSSGRTVLEKNKML